MKTLKLVFMAGILLCAFCCVSCNSDVSTSYPTATPVAAETTPTPIVTPVVDTAKPTPRVTDNPNPIEIKLEFVESIKVDMDWNIGRLRDRYDWGEMEPVWWYPFWADRSVKQFEKDFSVKLPDVDLTEKTLIVSLCRKITYLSYLESSRHALGYLEIEYKGDGSTYFADPIFGKEYSKTTIYVYITDHVSLNDRKYWGYYIPRYVKIEE